MKKKNTKDILPFFFFVLIIFVFFAKFFLKGLIPVPADIITGMYFPWYDYKWGYPAGVPVKNPILTDSVSQFWIWRNLAVESLKKGQILLWNSYAACGSPLVPLFHSALFSPLNLWYFLFSQETAMSLIVISQPLIALVFTYLFLRSLKLARSASTLGAMSFSFGSFMMVWLSWGITSAVAAGLPALLWGFEKFKTTKKIKFLLFQILALSFSLQNAHLQTFFYICFFWGLYLFYSISNTKIAKDKKKLFCSAIWILIIFLSINAFSILPAMEVLNYSLRNVEDYLSGRNYNFLPISQLIKFWVPDFFGNHATGNYWGPLNYQEFTFYFGLLPLVLAGIAITKLNKLPPVKFFFICFLLFLGLAFKYPFGWLIYRFRLPFLSSAPASRILILVNFCGAILAAYGLEEFRRLVNKNLIKKILLVFWTPIIGITAGSLIAFLQLKSFPNYANYQNLNLWITNLRVGLRNLVLPILFLLSVSVIFYLKTWKKRRLDQVLISLILLLTLVELFRFGWKITPFISRKMYFPTTPILEFLKNQKNIFRIERERGPLLPPNMWIPYRLASPSSYDPALPLEYSLFLQSYTGRKPTRFAELEKNDFNLFNLLNVQYFLAIKYLPDGRISPSGQIGDELKKRLKVVFEDGSVAILENKQVFPRAFLVDPQLLNLSISNLTPEKIKALMKDGKVVFNNLSEDSFLINVETNQNALMLISINSFPGWQAFMENSQIEILTSPLPFLLISIPEGEHNITFKYQPKSFRIGLLISSFGTGGLLLVSWIWKRRWL